MPDEGKRSVGVREAGREPGNCAGTGECQGALQTAWKSPGGTENCTCGRNQWEGLRVGLYCFGAEMRRVPGGKVYLARYF